MVASRFTTKEVIPEVMEHKGPHITNYMQAYLGHTAGFISDHLNKANITIKEVTIVFCFFSSYKSYVYTILY